MTEYGVSINLEPVTQDPSITAIHEVKFQPDLSINDGYTQKECTTDFAKLAVFARQSSKTNPIVADYSVLQRMQLAEMELQLAKYWAQYKARDLNVTWDEMRKMQNLFRNYCQGLRDLDFMHRLRIPVGEVEENEWHRRLDYFGEPAGIQTHYKAFDKPPSFDTDALMKFISDHLPAWAAWSRAEKKRRLDEFQTGTDKGQKPKPLEYSMTTRFLASVVITFFAASWLIVPIVIMTIPPQSAGRAWDLVVLSIAIVLFGGFAAIAVGPVSNTKDVVAATAAYAAVLVVFYGNIVSGH